MLCEMSLQVSGGPVIAAKKQDPFVNAAPRHQSTPRSPPQQLQQEAARLSGCSLTQRSEIKEKSKQRYHFNNPARTT